MVPMVCVIVFDVLVGVVVAMMVATSVAPTAVAAAMVAVPMNNYALIHTKIIEINVVCSSNSGLR